MKQFHWKEKGEKGEKEEKEEEKEEENLIGDHAFQWIVMIWQQEYIVNIRSLFLLLVFLQGLRIRERGGEEPKEIIFSFFWG